MPAPYGLEIIDNCATCCLEERWAFSASSSAVAEVLRGGQVHQLLSGERRSVRRGAARPAACICSVRAA